MPIDFTDRERWLDVRDAVYAAAFVAEKYNGRYFASKERAKSIAVDVVDDFERVHPEPSEVKP